MPTGPGPSTLWQAGTITGMVGLCWFHCRPKHKPDRLTVSRLPECYPGTRHHQFNMGQKQSRLHRGTIKSSGADATVILPPWETSSVGYAAATMAQFFRAKRRNVPEVTLTSLQPAILHRCLVDVRAKVFSSTLAYRS
jgi:hypothetical protein